MGIYTPIRGIYSSVLRILLSYVVYDTYHIFLSLLLYSFLFCLLFSFLLSSFLSLNLKKISPIFFLTKKS